jgi:protein gp37
VSDSSLIEFFKQWGGVQKSKRGRLLGGMTYDEMPNALDGDRA